MLTYRKRGPSPRKESGQEEKTSIKNTRARWSKPHAESCVSKCPSVMQRTHARAKEDDVMGALAVVNAELNAGQPIGPTRRR